MIQVVTFFFIFVRGSRTSPTVLKVHSEFHVRWPLPGPQEIFPAGQCSSRCSASWSKWSCSAESGLIFLSREQPMLSTFLPFLGWPPGPNYTHNTFTDILITQPTARHLMGFPNAPPALNPVKSSRHHRQRLAKHLINANHFPGTFLVDKKRHGGDGAHFLNQSKLKSGNNSGLTLHPEQLIGLKLGSQFLLREKRSDIKTMETGKHDWGNAWEIILGKWRIGAVGYDSILE